MASALPDTNNNEVIPLTIVTGFLGSGKTTLINHLLQLLIADNKKVAIVQNEFGDSANGVEDAFMSGSDGEIFTNVIELANGCVCCSVRDNFALAVEQLASEKKYDYILLECSGMADPAKLISMFWIDQDLEASIYLDGVLSVVDGKYLTSYLKDDKDEHALNDKQSLQIIHQIAFADKILINKRDLIKSEQDVMHLNTLIHSINNVGEILVTQKSQIKQISDVLYIRAYDMVKAPNFDVLLQQNKKEAIVNKVDKLIDGLNQELQHTHAHDHEGEHALDDMICAHDGNIKSLSMQCVGQCVDLDKVDDWLSELLWSDQYQQSNEQEEEEKGNDDHENTGNHKMDIYRMKAVLPTKDGHNHHLSSVRDLFEVEQGNTRWMNGKNDNTCLCKVVVIGKFLDKQILQKGFDSIFVQ
eukprot:32437_1